MHYQAEAEVGGSEEDTTVTPTLTLKDESKTDETGPRCFSPSLP